MFLREESVLEACGRLCFELRDRLKMVVEAQAKEQLAKEFDAIAVFDKADRRATELANIILVCCFIRSNYNNILKVEC